MRTKKKSLVPKQVLYNHMLNITLMHLIKCSGIVAGQKFSQTYSGPLGLYLLVVDTAISVDMSGWLMAGEGLYNRFVHRDGSCDCYMLMYLELGMSLC